MRSKLQSLLRMADLKEEEVQVYLWLLKLQKSSIPELRAKTHLPNITVYRAVQRLVGRELIEREPVNRKQSLYKPLTLKRLIRKVSAEQLQLRRLELALKNLDSYLPFMDMEQEEPAEDISVRLGKDAFKEEYLKFPEVLENEYLHIGNLSNLWKTLGFTYESPEERGFIRRRCARNLFARVLDVPTEDSLKVQANDSREKRTLVFKDRIPIKEDFLLIGEKQVGHFVCNSDAPRVIIMKSPTLLALHHDYFEKLWKSA
ncbi:MAG: helix-turn-helix domain-containing protein [Candidatus Peregrinibacteria bacterium]